MPGTANMVRGVALGVHAEGCSPLAHVAQMIPDG